MIRQDTIDHAEGFVTDRYEGPLARTFPRRLLLASLIVGCEVRLMRDQPHGIVGEPVSEVGTAHVRDLRQFSDTRATFEQLEIEAREFDELFAVVVRVNIAYGGQDGRRGGLADPGQLHQKLVVRSMCQECDGLVEPELFFRQGIDQSAGGVATVLRSVCIRDAGQMLGWDWLARSAKRSVASGLSQVD
jgi:hypothetical protein